MKLSPEEEIAKLALALREAAPREWEMFNAGFATYVSSSAENIYKSRPEDLARVQGFGQAMIYMRDLCANAPLIVEKAHERMKHERLTAAVKR
jgi:hypothetical protein